jgi:hypothetical protein
MTLEAAGRTLGGSADKGIDLLRLARKSDFAEAAFSGKLPD